LTTLVDLSHPWRVDLWPFLGVPSPTISDLARVPAQRVLMRQVTTSMHIGTHIDAPLHFAPGAGDMASLPLDTLCHEGVIVDVSDKLKEWDILYPEHITSKVDVKEGDILIVHYGWHHFYYGEREPNEERYFCYSPGPDREFAEWALKKKLRWFGVDSGSADHPMSVTPLRRMRPDLVKKFEAKFGKKVDDVFPEEDLDVIHTTLFPHRMVAAENVGGEIDRVLNRRCTVGAFPWKLVGGDGCICRIVAFLE
jgi:kynurenine formamidase